MIVIVIVLISFIVFIHFMHSSKYEYFDIEDKHNDIIEKIKNMNSDIIIMNKEIDELTSDKMPSAIRKLNVSREKLVITRKAYDDNLDAFVKNIIIKKQEEGVVCLDNKLMVLNEINYNKSKISEISLKNITLKVDIENKKIELRDIKAEFKDINATYINTCPPAS